jgi:hypothetical protein
VLIDTHQYFRFCDLSDSGFNGSGASFWSDGSNYGTISAVGSFTFIGNC